MRPDLTDAIVKITSSAAGNANFGTGFVIHRDAAGDYVLTCQHVVNAVGAAALRVEEQPAERVAGGDEEGFDLAVLRVAPGRLHARPLRLSATRTPCGQFVTRGYYRLNASTYSEDGYSVAGAIPLSETLSGRLALQQQTAVEQAGRRAPAWWLELPNAAYALQPGYSGAPVVDTASDRVIGIISIRRDAGQRGLAISAQALEFIWPQGPADLLDARPRPQAQQPVINLEAEREAFTRIVAGEDRQTRLLLVHGDSGMGKTYLVGMYAQIARAHDRKTIMLDLRDQLSVEDCLRQIVMKLGGFAHFPNYNQAKMEVIKAANARDEDKWELLTGHLFVDLEAYQAAAQIILLFDAYDREKPEESFKRWLTGILLPLLAHQTRLVVVIAGQEPVAPPQALIRCHRTLPLTGVSVETYQDYAAACQIELPLDHIRLLHEAFGGNPSQFAYFIRGRQTRAPQQEARRAG